MPDGIAVSVDEAASAWKAELARMREEGEVACEATIEVEPVAPETVAVVKVTWPEDAVGIDRTLRELAKDIAWRDLELAHLGRKCFEAAMWTKLGYASFEQYCRERIGLSASSVHGKVTLARRVGDLPEIEAAVADGQIGYESAALVARVASPSTVEAWVARANERTVKQLREEVDCVAMFARVEGRKVEGYEPPSGEMMAEAAMLEREVIAVVTGQEHEPAVVPPDVRDEEATVEVTTTTLRLTVSEDTARFWRGLEKVYARPSPTPARAEEGEAREASRGFEPVAPGSFVAFLVQAVLRAWSGAVPKKVAYADVYLRDRWTRASPMCASKHVTPHHIKFRSQGGGEERGNLLSLCEICHLDLVHGGHLTVVGDAEHGLVWRAAGWSGESLAAAASSASLSSSRLVRSRLEGRAGWSHSSDSAASSPGCRAGTSRAHRDARTRCGRMPAGLRAPASHRSCPMCAGVGRGAESRQRRVPAPQALARSSARTDRRSTSSALGYHACP